VDLIDIDAIGLQAFERLLERKAHKLRREIVRDLVLAPPFVAVVVKIVAELGGVDDLAADVGARPEGFGELLLAPAVAVGIGGIEQADPQALGLPEHSDGLVVGLLPPPSRGGGPEAETDLAHLDVAIGVSPILHTQLVEQGAGSFPARRERGRWMIRRMNRWASPSTVVLIGIILYLGLITYFANQAIIGTSTGGINIYNARLNLERVLVLAIEQQNALRGYVATQKPVFLRDFTTTAGKFDASADALQRDLTALHQPEAKKEFLAAVSQQREWRNAFARPVVADLSLKGSPRFSGGMQLMKNVRADLSAADLNLQQAIVRTGYRLQSIVLLLAAATAAGVLLLSFIALWLERGRYREERSLRLQIAERNAALERSNESLQEFAYVASHDLQEPLRTVASFTQLLQKRYAGKLGADADEFISYAVDGATRMQQLINGILQYSRVTTHGNPLDTVNLNMSARKAMENLRMAIEDKKAHVVIADLPSVEGDEVQLTQLLQNLIGNALKYNQSPNPRIDVTATRIDPEQWKLAVRDNGIGIAPEYHDRVFRIFQRLHTRNEYSGTGIGLALCRRIVERHGGRIWVESEEGQGATFAFTLPVEPRKAVAA